MPARASRPAALLAIVLGRSRCVCSPSSRPTCPWARSSTTPGSTTRRRARERRGGPVSGRRCSCTRRHRAAPGAVRAAGTLRHRPAFLLARLLVVVSHDRPAPGHPAAPTLTPSVPAVLPRCCHSVATLTAEHAPAGALSSRWAASGDPARRPPHRPTHPPCRRRDRRRPARRRAGHQAVDGRAHRAYRLRLPRAPRLRPGWLLASWGGIRVLWLPSFLVDPAAAVQQVFLSRRRPADGVSGVPYRLLAILGFGLSARKRSAAHSAAAASLSSSSRSSGVRYARWRGRWWTAAVPRDDRRSSSSPRPTTVIRRVPGPGPGHPPRRALVDRPGPRRVALSPTRRSPWPGSASPSRRCSPSPALRLQSESSSVGDYGRAIASLRARKRLHRGGWPDLARPRRPPAAAAATRPADADLLGAQHVAALPQRHRCASPRARTSCARPRPRPSWRPTCVRAATRS